MTGAVFPDDVTAPVQYGPRITAWVSYLLYAQFVPEKRLAELMSDLFAVSISTATITAMGRRTARRFEPFLAHVADVIRTAVPVKHLDETGLRIAARTVLTCSRRSSSRSSSRLSRCFRQIGRGRPSPVLSASSFWRRSRRTGSYSVMPCANRSPFMRLTFLTRSAVRDRRSRLICRRSSCSGVGAFAMAQTRGSPRLWASKALTKAAPSTPSVLTRRRRRDVAMEAGSTTGRVPGRGVGVVGASVSCG